MRKLLLHLGLWLVARFQEKEGEQSEDLINKSVQSNERKRVDISQDAIRSGWFNSAKDELFKGFVISSDDVILDVGCGDSPFLAFCAERGADILFADIEEINVLATEKKLKGSKAKSLIPIVTDANPLPLGNEVASKVMAMEVIEHVDDPEVFLSELVRVGKSKAQYLLTVPDPIAERLQQKGLAPESHYQKPNHIRIIEREEFIRMVKKSGLVVEQKTEGHGFYWAMWWIFFWVCKQEVGATPPHPLLASWARTWEELLSIEEGGRVKRILDSFMPKSQVILARKP